MDERQPEDGGEYSDDQSGEHDGGGSLSGGHLVETKGGGSLVDDRHGADDGDDREPEGTGDEGPSGRVFPDEDNVLDEQEYDSSKGSGHGGGDDETSKDGTETLSAVPAPAGGVESTDGDTDTGDGRDDRVGGRDGPSHLGGDGEPDGRDEDGVGETEELETGIVLENVGGDDTVLDRARDTGTDEDGTCKLEDGGGDDGLPHGQRFRSHGRCERVGDIVGTCQAR